MDGYEGVKRWIANKALSGVEASILKKLPASISAEQVKSEFDIIKKANRQRNVDLEKLNDALLKYQRKVGKAPPSTQQVEELFSDMRGAIIVDS
jgi:phage-related minor tail protein